MKICNHCGSESYRVESLYCLKCGTELPVHDATPQPKQNICTNAECEWHKTRFIYPDGARFCDTCGSPTENG